MNEPLKIIRNGVRCFYIKNNQVLCLKTKDTNLKPGFIDIPGGKIEENETMEQAAIREYKEETGLDVVNPLYRGVINIVFSNNIYRYNTFLIDDFCGEMQETEEHNSMLMNIDDVFKNEKRFGCIVMLEPSFLRVLLDETKTFELTIHTNEKEIINKIYFEIKDI